MIPSEPIDPAAVAQAGAVLAAAPRWYTYAEVAQAMRVSKQTVMGWVKDGRVASPTYFNTKALFSTGALARIAQGIDPAGTHVPAPSPRAEAARRGQKERARKDREAKARRDRRAARKQESQAQSKR